MRRLDLGHGLGLRSQHFGEIVERWPAIDWFEVISENFMDSHGRARWFLDQIAERYPVVMHGVSLSIGSADPLDVEYLDRLKALADAIRPALVSDHLCWTGVQGLNSHDLLPLPLTDETLEHVVGRILAVQDHLERPLVLENPSSYLRFRADTWTEWDFLAELARLTGCGLLVDVNNVYVSCFNHGEDPHTYLSALPVDQIVQLHVAGHQHNGDHIVDTHDGPVSDPVLELYDEVVARCGVAPPTLLEWDARIPSLDDYHAELLRVVDPDRRVAPNHVPVNANAVSNPVDFLVGDPLQVVAGG